MATKFGLCPAPPRPPTIFRWELHVGTVKLYIVGPGEGAMLACSEPYYTGTIGTPEERAIARHALEILNRDHLADREPGTRLIAATLRQARREIRDAEQAADTERRSSAARKANR